ncbi:hypothetical protein H0H93_009843 [Arthromyces matolae]|nr:hypothetical protein H0H93_009843 [Arthromyces matolae]
MSRALRDLSGISVNVHEKNCSNFSFCYTSTQRLVQYLIAQKLSLKYVKLPRSRSSPSPPSSRGHVIRNDATRKSANGRTSRRRLDSSSSNNTVRPKTVPTAPNMDWSTSYQAGSSSSASRSSDEDSETEDERHNPFRGRLGSRVGSTCTPVEDKQEGSSLRQRRSPHPASPSDPANGSTLLVPRQSFTRSRSPMTNGTPKSLASRHLSPAVSRPSRRGTPRDFTFFPTLLEFRIPLAPTSWTWTFSADFRKCGESNILLGAILYASYTIYTLPTTDPNIAKHNLWIVKELLFFSLAVVLYSLWTHSNLTYSQPLTSSPYSSSSSPSPTITRPPPLSPRAADTKGRNSSLITTPKTDFGFIWMTVPKNYRESSDDGVFTGLLLGPLIAAGLLISALRMESVDTLMTSPLPPEWRIEAPAELHNSPDVPTALAALIRARYNLVDLGTLCSTILLLHVCASWYHEARYSRRGNAAEGERTSVPRSEARRSLYYILFTLAVTCGIFALKVYLQSRNLGIWEHLSYFEVIFSHRGFTLGELGLVCFGGIALCMEFFNITKPRIWPIATPFYKTYRLPTPLLIFQIALIAGALLTGFLLSPLLVLSRHIAQRPVRRLRNPQDKQKNRRFLALGFYTGTFLIVTGVIGMWTRWCLGKRDPWLWVIFWLVEGKRKWTRAALVAYWTALGSLSVAGWNRQLARSRRYWHRNSVTNEPIVASTVQENTATTTPQSSEPSGATIAPVQGPTSIGVSGMTFSTLPALPALPNLPNGTQVASDLLDAADKHVPTLGLNARRKFFHALAVVMFVPGIAIDPFATVAVHRSVDPGSG